MDRRRYSLIAHAGIRFWNPLDEGELLRVLREVPLRPGAEVLDYGCGEGEVLKELLRHHEIQAFGIDVNGEAIARCRSHIDGEFIAEAFSPILFEQRAFDLIINLGASPGFTLLLEQMVPLLRPGGRLLIGDGYWKRSPSAEYLRFLGANESETLTHEGNLMAFRAMGLTVERSLETNQQAWSRYEDRYYANMCDYLRDFPDDPEAPEFEARCRTWREMYLKHGRETLGFALYQARLDDAEQACSAHS